MDRKKSDWTERRLRKLRTSASQFGVTFAAASKTLQLDFASMCVADPSAGCAPSRVCASARVVQLQRQNAQQCLIDSAEAEYLRIIDDNIHAATEGDVRRTLQLSKQALALQTRIEELRTTLKCGARLPPYYWR